MSFRRSALSPPRLRRRSLALGGDALLRLIGEAPRSADELVRASGRTSADVAAALVELELAGLVTMADGVYRAALDRRGLAG
jgi:predicted Rossmann fold nucleotide-binding protein DprA/Smf involved in DNA uptake